MAGLVVGVPGLGVEGQEDRHPLELGRVVQQQPAVLPDPVVTAELVEQVGPDEVQGQAAGRAREQTEPVRQSGQALHHRVGERLLGQVQQLRGVLIDSTLTATRKSNSPPRTWIW